MKPTECALEKSASSTPLKVKLVFDKILAVWEERCEIYTSSRTFKWKEKRRLLKTFQYSYLKALSTCELKQMKMSLTKERLECTAGRRFMNVCVFIWQVLKCCDFFFSCSCVVKRVSALVSSNRESRSWWWQDEDKSLFIGCVSIFNHLKAKKWTKITLRGYCWVLCYEICHREHSDALPVSVSYSPSFISTLSLSLSHDAPRGWFAIQTVPRDLIKDWRCNFCERSF